MGGKTGNRVDQIELGSQLIFKLEGVGFESRRCRGIFSTERSIDTLLESFVPFGSVLKSSKNRENRCRWGGFGGVCNDVRAVVGKNVDIYRRPFFRNVRQSSGLENFSIVKEDA